MRRFRLLGSICLGALLLSASSVLSQGKAGERVAGHVLSATDGHLIAGATLTLVNTESEATVATTASDGEGGFRFDAVPAGKYRLTGIAAGYLSGSYLEHEQFSTAIVTGAALATGELPLKLTPASEISGRVTDENGDPVQRASVELFRKTPSEPERISRYRSGTTEDEGEYDFVGLPPGDYFLCATGTPWYAVHPQAEAEGQIALYRTAVDPALDVAYPQTFYPNATDANDAAPITLSGGERVSADMQLRPQHAVSLTVQSASDTNPNESFPQLTRSVFGLREPIPVQIDFSNGVRRIVGIAPGAYDLQEVSPRSPFPVHTQSVDLTGGSAAVSLPSVAGTGGSITLKVHAMRGSSLPRQMQINLRNPQSTRAASSPVNEGGSAQFADLPGGDYRIVLYGDGRLLNVLSLAVDGKTMPDKLLHLNGTGSVPVDLTVSADRIEVSGIAQRGGVPSAGSMVVLVPAGADSSEDLFRRDQSDLDGSFLFRDVVPGDYIVVAIDDGWSLRWSDTATLTPFLLHGTPLAVASGAHSPVRIGPPVVVQAR